MKKSQELITGIIPTSSKPLIFSVQKTDFLFSFMTDSSYNFFINSETSETVKVPVKEEFIYGKTHENHNIAIYAGNMDFEVKGSQGLYTSAYVKGISNLSDTDISNFDGIVFNGKSLNDLFFIHGMSIDHSNNKIKYHNDSITYDVIVNELKINISIRSLVTEECGVHGTSLNNNKVSLTLTFDKSQTLKNFFKHYHTIKEIVSFLSYRQNVGFDEIFLLDKDMDKIAQVFVREEFEIEPKDRFSNICFNELEDVLPNLLKLFYMEDENGNPLFSVEFLPKNNKEIKYMNNQRIRTICAALEYETHELDEPTSDNGDVLQKLISETTTQVKEFRKQNIGLSNDTYNLIFENIKHWTFPIKEKLGALLDKYEEELSILTSSNVSIDKKSINKFIQYRNVITHSKYQIPNQDVAVTAHYMCGLIYCSLLSRMGLPKDKLKKLCQYKLLK